jgi:hypothetical protein
MGNSHVVTPRIFVLIPARSGDLVTGDIAVAKTVTISFVVIQ